ncbi:hypothetical protein [Streptomyces albipurpureus]|nr:hypothetical protein [Streptomyces sp. CWNU-1]
MATANNYSRPTPAEVDGREWGPGGPYSSAGRTVIHTLRVPTVL